MESRPILWQKRIANAVVMRLWRYLAYLWHWAAFRVWSDTIRKSLSASAHISVVVRGNCLRREGEAITICKWAHILSSWFVFFAWEMGMMTTTAARLSSHYAYPILENGRIALHCAFELFDWVHKCMMAGWLILGIEMRSSDKYLARIGNYHGIDEYLFSLSCVRHFANEVG